LRGKISSSASPMPGASMSVETAQGARHALYTRNVEAIQRKYQIPDTRFYSVEFGNAVLDDLYALAGKGKGSGDKAALEIATEIKNSYDRVYSNFNMHGRTMEYLETYAGWRKYSTEKLLGKKEAFIKYLLDPSLTDHEKTFYGLTGEQKIARANEMYSHIMGTKANTFDGHRSIHFMSGSAEGNFMKEFGAFDSYMESFGAQMTNNSKIVGYMDVFGPNYKEVVDDLIKYVVPEEDSWHRKLLRDMANDRLPNKRKPAEHHYTKLENILMKTLRGAKLWTSITHLGGAGLSAVGVDHVTMAALAKTVDNKGLLPIMAKTLGLYAKSFSWGDSAFRTQVAKLMLLQSYDVLAYMSEEAQQGTLGYLQRRAMDTFTKNMIPLAPHSESIRTALALNIGSDLYDQSGKTFDNLSAQAKHFFGRYNIGTGDWDIIRQSGHILKNEEVGLDIGILATEKILDPDIMPGIPAAQREAAFIKYGAMINDMAKSATAESTAFSRQVLWFGQEEGTPLGTLFRTLTLFKQAGINITATQLRIAKDLGPAVYWGQIFTMSTIAGALTLWAKDILIKGKTPRLWMLDDPLENNKEDIMLFTTQAMAMGAGGILGDYVTGEWHMGYMDILAHTVAGPVGQQAKTLIEFTAAAGRLEPEVQKTEMAHLLRRQALAVPYAGNPVIRGFLTEPILNSLHGMLDSNYPRNSRRRNRKYGQEQIIDFNR